MLNVDRIALDADLIVNGYAFTKDNDILRILNLNHTDKALVLSQAGEVLETSMDDIEIEIVLGYLRRNASFLEDSYA